MDDSLFHIVKRDDGQLEVVRLVPVKKKANSKSGKGANSENGKNHHTKCQSALKEYILPIPTKEIPNKIKETKEVSRISAPKKYSRVRKIDSSGNIIKNQPILINKKKIETDTTETTLGDSSVKIKIEPELDIVEDRHEDKTKTESDNVEQRLVPTGEHVVSDNQSIKTVHEVSTAPATNVQEDPNKLIVVNKPLLLELGKRNIKCNFCGMIFSKGDQVKTLRNHFLQHKTTVMKVGRKYTDVKFRSNELDERINSANLIKSSNKKPVILNGMVRCLSSKLKKSVSVNNYQDPNQKKFLIDVSSSSTLRRRKLINIKPISSNLLEQLRSNKLDPKNGKTHFMVGNTIIKPVKPASSNRPGDAVGVLVNRDKVITDSMEVPEAKLSDEANNADGDDDIEIVEEKPELIVIDDNDEEDANDKEDDNDKEGELSKT